MVALSNHCWTYCQFNDRKIPKENNKNRLRNKDSKTSLKEYELGGMKEANAIETTPKDSISNDMWLTLRL
jgi:hypothetical protein